MIVITLSRKYQTTTKINLKYIQKTVIQFLFLNSSFLQRKERGFQYSNSQNDFVEIIGSKKTC